MGLAVQAMIGAAIGAAMLPPAVAQECRPTFEPPGDRPDDNVRKYNGWAISDVCISHDGPYHVFVLGDWGGIGSPPQPAHNRGDNMCGEVDDQAQQLVAEQMDKLGLEVDPDYVINVGDSFYWGGIDRECNDMFDWSDQWTHSFNEVYSGGGLAGKPWLGVLGNHDYGGWFYSSGWPQMVSMTWVDARWFIPAQYWNVRVQYTGFDVDYYFVDDNYYTCADPTANPKHNICSGEHNGDGLDCSAIGGPASVETCPDYFEDLWNKQVDWLQEQLSKSQATWRIVVAHIPPLTAGTEWEWLSRDYGIDLILTGHMHYQMYLGHDAEENPVKPTTLIISGGGGGITSENVPHIDGEDDQYGFVDLALSKDVIDVRMISHGGKLRTSAKIGHCFEGDPGDKYFVRCGDPDTTVSTTVSSTTSSRPVLATTTTATGTTTTTTRSKVQIVSAESFVGEAAEEGGAVLRPPKDPAAEELDPGAAESSLLEAISHLVGRVETFQAFREKSSVGLVGSCAAAAATTFSVVALLVVWRASQTRRVAGRSGYSTLDSHRALMEEMASFSTEGVVS